MKFAEKQAERQKLIERQAHILKSMRNKEDEILNKQVEEAEEKALKLFEEQERRREALKEQVDVSRRQQMDKRKREKQAEYNEQQQFSEFWKLRSEELQLAEANERLEARNRKEDIQQYLKKQVDTRHKKAEEEFKAELE
jgi:hypothetical protein